MSPASSELTLADRLGQFASTVDAGSLDRAIRDRAAIALLDTVGVIVAATGHPEFLPVAGFLSEVGARDDASAFGIGRTSARDAAYCNGWLADLLDFADTLKHPFGGIHPGATVIPAAIAMTEREGSSSVELLSAIVAGYEVANRVARALYPSPHLTTGTAGALGAAAAAGRILRLDSTAMSHALRIAGFLLPMSPGDTMWEGFSAKPGHAAQAAATGVEAALLAMRGLTGAPLEGGLRAEGLLNVATERASVSEALADLGAKFTLPQCTIKLYPCCGFMHGAIDAAIQLHGRLKNSAVAIDSVVVASYSSMIRTALGERYTDTQSSYGLCQFSLPYVVAVALLDGEVSVSQFDAHRRADPAVHALAKKVSLVEEPAFTAMFPRLYPFEVRVSVGRDTHIARVDAARGTPQHPLTSHEVRAKFDSNVVPRVGSTSAANLAEAIFRTGTEPVMWPHTLLGQLR